MLVALSTLTSGYCALSILSHWQASLPFTINQATHHFLFIKRSASLSAYTKVLHRDQAPVMRNDVSGPALCVLTDTHISYACIDP